MSQQKIGKFITVEGIEGVGKSTNIAFIADWLKQQGYSVIQTREPGGTPFAEELRELLLRRRDEKVSENSELLLMFAARAQHLEQLIKPALEAGDWVLSDRFIDATYAYQGGGRGVALDKIAQLEDFVQGDFRPSLTLILDASPAVGMARVARRGQEDRFESERIDFFERVRAIYLERARQAPERYAVINAELALEQVQAQIAQVLQERLV